MYISNKKRKKYIKAILGLILFSVLFTVTIKDTGIPLTSAIYDYKTNHYGELEGTVTEISRDNNDIFLYIDGGKYKEF